MICFYHDDIKQAISQLFIECTDVKAIHGKLAAYFLNKTDPSGDHSFTGRSLRDYRQTLYHLLLADNWKTLVSLNLQGFMDSYAKIETPENIFRTTHQIIDYFSNLNHELTEAEENSIWQAGLQLLKIYNHTASRIAKLDIEIPHPIERAILEGRDDDVNVLIAAASENSCSCLRLAAATLYRAAGRDDMAEPLEALILPVKNQLLNHEQQVLFNALHIAETNDKAEKKKTAEKTDSKTKSPKKFTSKRHADNRQNKSVKPRSRIPALHYFALTFNKTYSIFSLLLLSVLIWCSPLNLIIWTDRLYALISEFFLAGLIDLIIKLIALGVMLSFVGGIVYYLKNVPKGYVQNHCQNQIDAMINFVNKSGEAKKQHTLLRLLRYCRLLNAANISFTFPEKAEKALTSYVWDSLSLRNDKDSAILLSCMISAGLDSKLIVKQFEALHVREKNAVLLNVLSHKPILHRTKEDDLLEMLFSLFGGAPPAPILSTVLSLECKGEKNMVVDILRRFNNNILASCLLRSRFPAESLKKNRLTSLLRKSTKLETILKKLFQRLKQPISYYLVEPVSLEWYNILIRFCLVIIPAILIACALYYTVVAIAYILLLYGVAMASLILLWCLGVIYFETDTSFDAFINAAALCYDIALHPSAAQDILKRCTRKKNETLFHSLQLCENKRYLLPALIDANVDLGVILSLVSKDKQYEDQKGHPPKRVYRKRQRSNTKLNVRFVLWELLCGILGAAICTCILFGLYSLDNLWLQLMIDHWYLYFLAASFLCSFVKPLNFILPVAVFIALGIFYADGGLLEPNFGAFIFYIIPTSSILLSSFWAQSIQGNNLLFPTIPEAVWGKLKTIILGAFGIIGTIALIFVLLFADARVKGASKDPFKDTQSAFQNYTVAQFEADRPSELDKGDIFTIITSYFSNKTVYQYNIFNRTKKSLMFFNTAFALEKFGYNDEAGDCILKFKEYSGFDDVKTIEENGIQKTVYVDAQLRRLPIAFVVTGIEKESEAAKIG